MTSRDEKLADDVDRVLTELEREATRELTVSEDTSTTRIELRSVSWIRLAFAAPLLLLSSWLCIAAVKAFWDGGGTRHAAALIPSGLAAIVLGVLGVILISVRESIVISPQDLIVSSGIGRFRRTLRVPISEIEDVRVGAFTFAPWDPYVVVVTVKRTYRFAWGVSGPDAHGIAQRIRRTLRAG